MKIVGYIGSSRKDGNTAWAINKILEGAKEQGAETRSWCFSEARLSACIRLNTGPASAAAQREKTKPESPVLSARWYYI